MMTLTHGVRPLGVLGDAFELLAIVLLVPVAILAIGAPLAGAVWILLALMHRLWG